MLSKEAPVRLRQRGVILIEALIGILIFSMGILALVAMQTAAVSAQSDAQYRIEAGSMVDKLLYEMSLNVDRTTSGSLQASLASFAHQATGGNCNFTGIASANALVTSWVTEVTAARTGLPGSTAAMQQILVDTTNFNQVTVTVCWMGPNETTAHKHTVISYIN
jgi:type IV pilus assembly protein PilV